MMQPVRARVQYLVLAPAQQQALQAKALRNSSLSKSVILHDATHLKLFKAATVRINVEIGSCTTIKANSFIGDFISLNRLCLVV